MRQSSPRPLPLHLGLSMATSMSGLAALPSARAGLLPWSATLAPGAEALTQDLKATDDRALTLAVGAEAMRRVETMLAGIQAYRDHPWSRPEPSQPIPWRQGSARLLDYGGEGPAVLFVPSLVNRYYVLDLLPGRSLLAWLADAGVHPFVLDWGAPGDDERAFSIADYVDHRLAPALARVHDLAGGPPILVGYCMGGLLTLAQAVREPASLRALALLATPWDFHAEAYQGQALVLLRQALETMLRAYGELPVDLLQMLFAALDPHLARRKFARFAAMDPASEQARQFVALEDWLNDGVALTAPVARTALFDWYGENRTAGGCWQVGDRAIDPAGLSMSVFCALPTQDRIVPPDSAAALAAALPQEHLTRINPGAGHIGMVMGGRGRRQLWQPLRDWCLAVNDNVSQ